MCSELSAYECWWSWRTAVPPAVAQLARMAKVDEYQPMLLERPLNLDEPGWIYELKMDGYRVLAEFDRAVQLRNRNGDRCREVVSRGRAELGPGESRAGRGGRRGLRAGRAGPQRLRPAPGAGAAPTPTPIPKMPRRGLLRFRPSREPRCRHHAAAAAPAQGRDGRRVRRHRSQSLITPQIARDLLQFERIH
jgi:hypothetical protein